MFSANDLTNNQQAILDYLDTDFFTDSTVTMMPDKYLKKTLSERLCQMVLMTDNHVSLNEDVNELQRAMLHSSLNDKDIDFMLTASLKCAGVSLNIGTGTQSDESLDTLSEEEKEEVANEKEYQLRKKMATMGSLDSLIGIIKDQLGGSRAYLSSSTKALFAALHAGFDSDDAEKDCLTVVRPLTLDLSSIDFSVLDNATLFDVLNQYLANDSNAELTMDFPLAAIKPDIKDAITTGIVSIIDAAIQNAKNSSKNSVMFTKEPDAFETLFGSL